VLLFSSSLSISLYIRCILFLFFFFSFSFSLISFDYVLFFPSLAWVPPNQLRGSNFHPPHSRMATQLWLFKIISISNGILYGQDFAHAVDMHDHVHTSLHHYPYLTSGSYLTLSTHVLRVKLTNASFYVSTFCLHKFNLI